MCEGMPGRVLSIDNLIAFAMHNKHILPELEFGRNLLLIGPATTRQADFCRKVPANARDLILQHLVGRCPNVCKEASVHASQLQTSSRFQLTFFVAQSASTTMCFWPEMFFENLRNHANFGLKTSMTMR